MGEMISIPVAVHTDLFKWELDLFWFNHRMTYDDADKRAKAIIVKRNYLHEEPHHALEWPIQIPHHMCESLYDYLPSETGVVSMGHICLPLNIQVGLAQVLHTFDDDQVIEVLDCDMFHFRKAPEMQIDDDELYVCDLYEEWHLKSLTEHRNVIDIYFQNEGKFYNGGFVPIVGKVRTFKRIMYEWTAVHIDILKRDYWPELIKWWAGMYALQAACEKARVTMIAKDFCYIPGANALADHHYLCHYSIDAKFNKKTFPKIDVSDFERNVYYDRVLQWLEARSQDFPELAGAAGDSRRLMSSQ